MTTSAIAASASMGRTAGCRFNLARKPWCLTGFCTETATRTSPSIPWSSAPTTLTPIGPSPTTATRKSAGGVFNEFAIGSKKSDLRTAIGTGAELSHLFGGDRELRFQEVGLDLHEFLQVLCPDKLSGMFKGRFDVFLGDRQHLFRHIAGRWRYHGCGSVGRINEHAKSLLCLIDAFPRNFTNLLRDFHHHFRIHLGFPLGFRRHLEQRHRPSTRWIAYFLAHDEIEVRFSLRRLRFEWCRACSPPPCGEGSGVGVAGAMTRSYPLPDPSPTLPRKGGGRRS